MFGLSPGELFLIALVALVLFGANKIPEFMKGLGKGMKEFKKAASDIQDNINLEDNHKKDLNLPNKSEDHSNQKPST